MNLSHITGSFYLEVPASKERCVDHVAQAVFLALGMEKPSTTTRHQNTITYRRGFSVGRVVGQWVRLGIFDPIIVCVDRCENGIVVNYELGFLPLYKIAPFEIAFLTLLYFYGGSLKIAMIVSAFYLINRVGYFAWSIYQTRKLLKSAAVDSIRYLLEGENIDKTAVTIP